MVEKTLFFNSNQSSLFKDIQPKYIASSETEAIHVFIDHPDIVNVVFDGQATAPALIKKMIGKASLLNPLIAYIIVNPVDSQDISEIVSNSGTQGKIFPAKDYNEAQAILTKLNQQENKRHAHRINWPLKVKINFSDPDLKHKTVWGFAISLSAGGCFVKCYYEDSLFREPLTLSIYFRGFHFMSEGRILRKDFNKDKTFIKSFAFAFKNVSPQTKNVIKEIINDKLSYLLLDENLHAS